MFVFAFVNLGWFALSVLVVWSLWLYVCVVFFVVFSMLGVLVVCICLSGLVCLRCACVSP